MYFISTIAGTGLGTLKVNVPALEAKFGGISGIVQSKNGDLYVVARTSNVVLKLEFNKQEGTWSNVEVIAGTGSPGKGSDNVLGTQSACNFPGGLSLVENANGDVTAVLIVDMNNHRLRQLDMSTHIITTIAGTGLSGFSGDGGSAKDAQLWFPRHVSYDKSNGDIYIADANGNRIRRVRGGIITTVAGKTCALGEGLGDGGQAVDACLKTPSQFTINGAGEWLIADRDNYRIRKVDSNGIITTVAGGGTEIGDALATSVKLRGPEGVAFTPSGELLVADYSISLTAFIRKMDHSGFMKVIAGGGSESPPSNTHIRAKTASVKPLAVAYARDGSDAIFIGDYNGFIFKLTNRTKCYGIESDNSDVCSGHGSCIGPDECECDSGWMEANCSRSDITQCFDVMSNETSVCSGHGSCIAPDHCQCDDGWLGVDCSITHCFGVTSNVPDVVCSGKGECARHNKCKCYDGYRGHKCHRPPRLSG